MVTSLRKQAADDQGTGEPPPLRYSAAWASGTVGALDARQAVCALLAHAPYAGHAPMPESAVLDAELVGPGQAARAG